MASLMSLGRRHILLPPSPSTIQSQPYRRRLLQPIIRSYHIQPVLPRPQTKSSPSSARMPQYQYQYQYQKPRPQPQPQGPQLRLQSQSIIKRAYSSSPTTGKSQADIIVEELQDLYETATDEFEIATESTDGATIYAASDRESARDALNHLVTVYSLYTTDLAAKTELKDSGGHQDMDEGDEGRLVELEFDPAEVSTEAKEEVKKRVGQRIRELENAVQLLELRAKSD